MRYLREARILDIAVRLNISRPRALEYMRSLSYRTAIEYAGAWGKYFSALLEREVLVTFSCDNWHVSYKEPK